MFEGVLGADHSLSTTGNRLLDCLKPGHGIAFEQAGYTGTYELAVRNWLGSYRDVCDESRGPRVNHRDRVVLSIHDIEPCSVWMDVNTEERTITIRDLPSREQIDTQVQEQLVVELYSK